jgi:hypothetical protein
VKYALSEDERKRRRQETARMTKCPCGNVARRGETRCGRCIADEQEADNDPRAIIRDLLEHCIGPQAEFDPEYDGTLDRARAYLGEG